MSAPVKGMSCSRCIYFERTDENFGECRRYAPRPNCSIYVPKNESVGGFKNDVHWPKVFNSNWCGQFSLCKKDRSQSPVNSTPRKRTPPITSDEQVIRLAPKEDDKTPEKTPSPNSEN